MVKKLRYITYQTFPARTANSIQTISTIKHLSRAELETTLIYPLRNKKSSDNIVDIQKHYNFEDQIKLIGTIHPLPFKKIKYFEKYWYLISHLLWSFFTVQKYFSSENEMYFTRSEWVFYFLSKKNANVIYECHQISKFKKILINKSLKKEKSKVIALTDEIKNEISPLFESKVHIFSSAFDDDFFYEKSEKKNHIVYAGSLFRFGKSRGLEILFENLSKLKIDNLKIIIISSDEDEIKSFENFDIDLEIYRKLNQEEVGEILSSAKVGLLINNSTKHAELYSSPLKYFEYIAAGLNVVATDLISHRKLPLSAEINFYDEGNVESFESALIDAVNKENKNITSVEDYSMTARVNKILHLFK